MLQGETDKPRWVGGGGGSLHSHYYKGVFNLSVWWLIISWRWCLAPTPHWGNTAICSLEKELVTCGSAWRRTGCRCLSRNPTSLGGISPLCGHRWIAGRRIISAATVRKGRIIAKIIITVILSFPAWNCTTQTWPYRVKTNIVSALPVFLWDWTSCHFSPDCLSACTVPTAWFLFHPALLRLRLREWLPFWRTVSGWSQT